MIDIRKSLCLLATLAIVFSCSDDNNSPEQQGGSSSKNENRNIVNTQKAVAGLEFPRLKGGNNKLIVHENNDGYGVNYSVEWDCDKKSQRWSCYFLTTKNKKSNTSRYYGDPQYPFDPALTADEYWPADYYYGSGFDHGHICPSNDRLYSSTANYQTFFLTNMQPQYKAFNGSDPAHKYKGLWINMENFVHNVRLSESDTLFVCKGGTIDSEEHILSRIQGKLIVPKYFFAAILLKHSTGYRSLGFWFEHSPVYHGDDPLSGYTVSIDELEKRTGIDFFCNLPDDIEAKTESSYSLVSWGNLD